MPIILSRPTRGFTLLEILVVLVLVGLVSTLVMEGFSFAINLQGRLKTQIVDNQLRSIQEQWFRQVSRAFYEASPSAKNTVFTGTQNRIIGMSLVSLSGNVGIPTKTTWLIETTEDGQQLAYQSGDIKKTIIATWHTDDLHFQYLGADGEFYQRWPPAEGARQLPKGILLSSLSKGGSVWYISISATDPPMADYQALE